LSLSFELVSPLPKLNPEEPFLSVAADEDPPNEKPVVADSFLSPPSLEAADADTPPPNEKAPAAR